MFRYANVYDRAIAVISPGKVDLKPPITEPLPFEQSIAALNEPSGAGRTMRSCRILVGRGAPYLSCSDKATYSVGSTYFVDGGMLKTL